MLFRLSQNAKRFIFDAYRCIWILFDELLPDNPKTDFAFRNSFFQPIGTNKPVVLDMGFHIVELERRMMFELFGILQYVGRNQEMTMRMFQ